MERCPPKPFAPLDPCERPRRKDTSWRSAGGRSSVLSPAKSIHHPSSVNENQAKLGLLCQPNLQSSTPVFFGNSANVRRNRSSGHSLSGVGLLATGDLMAHTNVTLASLDEAGSHVRLPAPPMDTENLTCASCRERTAGVGSAARRIGSFPDARRRRPESDGGVEAASMAGREQRQLSPGQPHELARRHPSSVAPTVLIIGPWTNGRQTRAHFGCRAGWMAFWCISEAFFYQSRWASLG